MKMLLVNKAEQFWQLSHDLKFSFSENATKFGQSSLPYGFDIYLVNLKTIRQIAQIFEAFSKKLNFLSGRVVF